MRSYFLSLLQRTDAALREQLVPMFGLVALEEQVSPETTLDKILFLVKYAGTHSHKLTTLISFGVLLILIFLRFFKESFKKTWWIYRIPEILVVVVASTCKLGDACSACSTSTLTFLQGFPMSCIGIEMASQFSVSSLFQQASISSSFL